MGKIQKTSTKLSFFENLKKWPLIIFLLVFVLYGNTFFNKYSLDDEFVIKDNKLVQQGIQAIPEILSSPYFQSKDLSFGYRPITKVVFAIEYTFFGENPFVSHFINVLLFAVTCLLFLKLLIKIILPKTGPLFIFIALLFWIFHPIHTEVVASLKNREEILYLIFCLLSLQFFIRFVEHQKWYFLLVAVVLFALSFLTKQSAISFAMIIPMVLWFMYVKIETVSSMIRNNIRIIISTLLLFVVTYVMYKIPEWFFPTEKITLLSFENPLHFDHSKIAKISVSAYAMLLNLKLLILPHPLVFYYGQFTIPEIHITDIFVIFSLLLHAVIVFFVVKYLRNKSVLIFGTLFYFLGIFPFSNYFMEINGIVAERFLYAPSFGFGIALTFGLFKLSKTPMSAKSIQSLSKNLKYIVVCIVLAYSVKTIARNAAWKDSTTLYSTDIKYLNNSVKANDILAQHKMDKIMRELPLKKSFAQLKPGLDSIFTLYERSMELYPANPKALNNLANLSINFYNNPKKALAYLQKAYSYKNNSVEVISNLAQCYELLKQDTIAARYYAYAVSIDTKQYRLWQNLIALYFKNGMPEKAKSTCELLQRKDTLTDLPFVGLGYYYTLQKDTLHALQNWEKAVVKNPRNYEMMFKLSKYYSMHSNPVKSQYYHKQAVIAKGR